MLSLTWLSVYRAACQHSFPAPVFPITPVVSQQDSLGCMSFAGRMRSQGANRKEGAMGGWVESGQVTGTASIYLHLGCGGQEVNNASGSCFAPLLLATVLHCSPLCSSGLSPSNG